MSQPEDPTETYDDTAPIHVDDPADLQSIADTFDVVLADFYADWCGPCKMLEPIVETLAKETDAAVAKVDVDVHQQLAAQYQVRGVPTMVLFVNGSPEERIVGVRGEADLKALVNQHLD